MCVCVCGRRRRSTRSLWTSCRSAHRSTWSAWSRCLTNASSTRSSDWPSSKRFFWTSNDTSTSPRTKSQWKPHNQCVSFTKKLVWGFCRDLISDRTLLRIEISSASLRVTRDPVSVVNSSLELKRCSCRGRGFSNCGKLRDTFFPTLCSKVWTYLTAAQCAFQWITHTRTKTVWSRAAQYTESKSRYCLVAKTAMLIKQ